MTFREVREKSQEFLRAHGLWIGSIVFAQVWTAISSSLHAPFYPKLARERNLEQYQYSLVFSVNKIMLMIAALAAEFLIKKISLRNLLIIGISGMAAATAGIGGLYWIEDKSWFYGASMCFFVAYGLCIPLMSVSGFTILIQRFPTSCILYIAMMETVWGLGNSLGSYVGGILIDRWSYSVPFFVTTIGLTTSIPIVLMFCPHEKPSDRRKEGENSPKGPTVWQIVGDPFFILDWTTFSLVWTITGFNDATMEQHMTEEFNFSAKMVGYMFTTQYVMYVAGSTVWSLLAIKLKMEELFLALATALAFIAYALMGPAPFLPITLTKEICFVAEIFIGLAIAALFVCAYASMVKNIMIRGLPTDVITIAKLSSMAFAMLYFGCVVSPMIGGTLMQKFGYQKASYFVLSITGIWTILLVVRLFLQRNRKIIKNES